VAPKADKKQKQKQKAKQPNEKRRAEEDKPEAVSGRILDRIQTFVIGKQLPAYPHLLQKSQRARRARKPRSPRWKRCLRRREPRPSRPR
jgi:hypothetical protein